MCFYSLSSWRCISLRSTAARDWLLAITSSPWERVIISLEPLLSWYRTPFLILLLEGVFEILILAYSLKSLWYSTTSFCSFVTEVSTWAVACLLKDFKFGSDSVPLFLRRVCWSWTIWGYVADPPWSSFPILATWITSCTAPTPKFAPTASTSVLIFNCVCILWSGDEALFCSSRASSFGSSFWSCLLKDPLPVRYYWLALFFCCHQDFCASPMTIFSGYLD